MLNKPAKGIGAWCTHVLQKSNINWNRSNVKMYKYAHRMLLHMNRLNHFADSSLILTSTFICVSRWKRTKRITTKSQHLLCVTACIVCIKPILNSMPSCTKTWGNGWKNQHHALIQSTEPPNFMPATNTFQIKINIWQSIQFVSM